MSLTRRLSDAGWAVVGVGLVALSVVLGFVESLTTRGRR